MRRAGASRKRRAVPGLLAQVGLVAVGGAAGAVTRLLVGLLVTARLGQLLPWGTLLVNVTGCFAIGLLFGALDRQSLHPVARPLLGTGFLGGYTTFSTFGAETVALIEEGHVLLAVAYVGGSLALGLAGTVAGLALGRSVA